MQPLPRQQRIGAVDVLRGFALLGVVVVNTQAFAGHLPPLPGTLADRIAAWLVAWLLTAKSYSLFSLLFGLGFAIQMERAEARGQDFGPFFRRRCLILFLIGVANAVLLFEGDILTLYAILGLALLLFRRSTPATLVRWAVGLLSLAVAINLLGALAFTSVPQTAGGAGGTGRAGAEGAEQAAREVVYRTGSYFDVVRVRLGPALNQAIGQLVLGFPNVFAMFLLGLALGRVRAFAAIEEHLPLFRALCRWGAPAGAPPERPLHHPHHPGRRRRRGAGLLAGRGGAGGRGPPADAGLPGVDRAPAAPGRGRRGAGEPTGWPGGGGGGRAGAPGPHWARSRSPVIWAAPSCSTWPTMASGWASTGAPGWRVTCWWA